MGPITGQSAQGVYQAFERFNESARALRAADVRTQNDTAARTGDNDRVQASRAARETDRVNAMVGLIEAETQLKASTAALRTEQEMTDRLLDIRV